MRKYSQLYGGWTIFNTKNNLLAFDTNLIRFRKHLCFFSHYDISILDANDHHNILVSTQIPHEIYILPQHVAPTFGFDHGAPHRICSFAANYRSNVLVFIQCSTCNLFRLQQIAPQKAYLANPKNYCCQFLGINAILHLTLTQRMPPVQYVIIGASRSAFPTSLSSSPQDSRKKLVSRGMALSKVPTSLSYLTLFTQRPRDTPRVWVSNWTNVVDEKKNWHTQQHSGRPKIVTKIR